MHRRSLLAAVLFFLAAFDRSAAAQRTQATLTEGEIEQIRESSYIANDRVLVFIKLMDTRLKTLEDMYAKPRRPGREQDTHDLFGQIGALADELDDNLADYSPRHRDIRKSLPKLVEATERWATIARTPPDNATYNIARRIALESIQDIHETATQMIEEQKAWFAAHPPQKEDTFTEQSHPR
jgi:hypothetical protein